MAQVRFALPVLGGSVFESLRKMHPDALHFDGGTGYFGLMYHTLALNLRITDDNGNPLKMTGHYISFHIEYYDWNNGGIDLSSFPDSSRFFAEVALSDEFQNMYAE